MRGFPGSEITALVNQGMSPFFGSFDHGFGSTKRAVVLTKAARFTAWSAGYAVWLKL